MKMKLHLQQLQSEILQIKVETNQIEVIELSSCQRKGKNS